jgi:ABC-2 type transport system permease protein
MRKLIRSALVIGRRDFTATVLSRTFIFFLLGPLFPALFGVVFGSIGAQVAERNRAPLVSVAAPAEEFARLSAARERVAAAAGRGLVRLVPAGPVAEPAAEKPDALLVGLPDHAELVGAFAPDSSEAAQVRLIVEAARGGTDFQVVKTTAKAPVEESNGRTITAQAVQGLLFFLTMLLAGMTLSQLIEEKSNKVIEILAAAVPIEAVFVGKLFAMLGASLVGIAVWSAGAIAAIALFTHGGVAALPPPAVGWPAFVILAIVYFSMNYLLLGSVFLSIGAQASTVREVQTLSMPVTMSQVLIFGFAAMAVGAPNSPAAIGGAIFPLSSGLVMVARAAEVPHLWPHLAALLWQAVWVALIVRISAGIFRRTVLKSGPRRRGFWRKSADSVRSAPM